MSWVLGAQRSQEIQAKRKRRRALKQDLTGWLNEVLDFGQSTASASKYYARGPPDWQPKGFAGEAPPSRRSRGTSRGTRDKTSSLHYGDEGPQLHASRRRNRRPSDWYPAGDHQYPGGDRSNDGAMRTNASRHAQGASASGTKSKRRSQDPGVSWDRQDRGAVPRRPASAGREAQRRKAAEQRDGEESLRRPRHLRRAWGAGTQQERWWEDSEQEDEEEQEFGGGSWSELNEVDLEELVDELFGSRERDAPVRTTFSRRG